jgi:hypothetical protein
VQTLLTFEFTRKCKERNRSTRIRASKPRLRTTARSARFAALPYRSSRPANASNSFSARAGATMSPRIRTEPRSAARSSLRCSGGCSRATSTPRLVIEIDSPVFRTCSISRRHFALNADAVNGHVLLQERFAQDYVREVIQLRSSTNSGLRTRAKKKMLKPGESL